jgi:hypothetical protein
MEDLKSRLANRVQLTTDGCGPYLHAVEDSFGADIDYAQIIKIYGKPRQSPGLARYSPAQIVAAERKRIEGSPDPAHISTSMVERHNLTIRMALRRFTSRPLASIISIWQSHCEPASSLKTAVTWGGITVLMCARCSAVVW